jgi:hypothetical protein
MWYERRDTFATTRYKGYWIHTHCVYNELDVKSGKYVNREVVSVQDPETLASLEVRSFRAAQLYITRRVKCVR